MTIPIQFREPRLEDGAKVYALIRACPPLDVNSAYAYFLLSDHFRHTTVVAESEGKLVGCITAYLRQDQPDVLFVWQVAVHADARGQGLAKRMLNEVANRPAAAKAKWMETTISPSNAPSRRLFASWAESRKIGIEEKTYLEPEHFAPAGDDAAHEAECLFRMGPLPGQTSA
ncbi:MAG: diaminobutyrate acetyltransferase [Verrucomicrobia bacterium]|nr:diaminobutyrate acetyltransferase [Verrucomicrobiota bacterium]MCH8512658.1 diaminobutyrate acetyltransferase [Kiritimatiellia bacterium]